GGVQAWSVLLTGWVAILAVLATTQVGAAWAFVAAVIALVPAAGAGHGAGGLFHTVAVSAMWLHLIGIGIWVGGLLMLMLVGGGRMREMIARYSTSAGWGFAIVLVSGVLNAVVRLNTPTELLSTGWGQLVLVKSVSFIALGLAGYTHREYVLK